MNDKNSFERAVSLHSLLLMAAYGDFEQAIKLAESEGFSCKREQTIRLARTVCGDEVADLLELRWPLSEEMFENKQQSIGTVLAKLTTDFHSFSHSTLRKLNSLVLCGFDNPVLAETRSSSANTETIPPIVPAFRTTMSGNPEILLRFTDKVPLELCNKDALHIFVRGRRAEITQIGFNDQLDPGLVTLQLDADSFSDFDFNDCECSLGTDENQSTLGLFLSQSEPEEAHQLLVLRPTSITLVEQAKTMLNKLLEHLQESSNALFEATLLPPLAMATRRGEPQLVPTPNLLQPAWSCPDLPVLVDQTVSWNLLLEDVNGQPMTCPDNAQPKLHLKVFDGNQFIHIEDAQFKKTNLGSQAQVPVNSFPPNLTNAVTNSIGVAFDQSAWNLEQGGNLTLYVLLGEEI